MNHRRLNQEGADESDHLRVSRNTRSSGNASIAYDDNAGMPRRPPRRGAAVGHAEASSAARTRRDSTERGRADTRGRSASPVRQRGQSNEDQRSDPLANVTDDNGSTIDRTTDNSSDTLIAYGHATEREVFYDAPEEPAGEAGARENNQDGNAQPNETLLSLITTSVLQEISNRVVEQINLHRHNQQTIDNIIQAVLQGLLEENLNQPNGGVIGRYIRRILAEQRDNPSPPPALVSSDNDASASRSSSGASSTTAHPLSTASEGSPTNQGDQVQARPAVEGNEVYNRRMLLQQCTTDDENNWESVGHVDWIYRGGRSVQCLYHGVSGYNVAIAPPHDLLLDYLIDAQRILHEYPEEANRADNMDMEIVEP